MSPDIVTERVHSAYSSVLVSVLDSKSERDLAACWDVGAMERDGTFRERADIAEFNSPSGGVRYGTEAS